MKSISLFLLLFFLSVYAKAQDSLFKFQVTAQGLYNSDGQVPFWFRSNQFGSIPLEGASPSFIGRASKEYVSDRSKLFDWGAGFEGRAK
jgi:hypothetical protein